MPTFKLSKLLLATMVVTILLDQISKFVAVRQGIALYNRGVSLGLFTLVPALFLTVSLIVLLVLIWWWYRSFWQAMPIASGLFFGGGISNVIDRLLLGSVRDWLPLPLITIHNNLADYAIAVGLISLLFTTLLKKYQGEIRADVADADNEAITGDDAK